MNHQDIHQVGVNLLILFFHQVIFFIFLQEGDSPSILLKFPSFEDLETISTHGGSTMASGMVSRGRGLGRLSNLGQSLRQRKKVGVFLTYVYIYKIHI